jgi:hypothetical protein
MMLVPKLLRIDEVTIQELEELAQKLSEKEYTSFSALVRKLIRKGLNNMETTENNFLDKVQKLSNGNSKKEKVLQHIKLFIESLAKLERQDYSFTLRAFNREVERALGMLDNSDLIASNYIEILEYVVSSLRKDGLEIKFLQTQHEMIQFNIYW